MKLLAALLALPACAPSIPASRTAPQNGRQVIGRATFFSRADWESSPWYRPGESVSLPVYVFLTHGQMACVVPGSDFVHDIPQGQLYSCLGAWRSPR